MPFLIRGFNGAQAGRQRNCAVAIQKVGGTGVNVAYQVVYLCAMRAQSFNELCEIDRMSRVIQH
jgi:hypothetical protein